MEITINGKKHKVETPYEAAIKVGAAIALYIYEETKKNENSHQAYEINIKETFYDK